VENPSEIRDIQGESRCSESSFGLNGALKVKKVEGVGYR
jgi:hypothetical protein